MLNHFSVLFFIIGIGWVTCPPNLNLSPGQIQSHSSINNKPFVYMYGSYYDMTDIVAFHLQNKGDNAKLVWEKTTLGNDVSQMFSPLTNVTWPQKCSYQYSTNYNLFPFQAPSMIDGTWLTNFYLKGRS